jgi:hypothetical protein
MARNAAWSPTEIDAALDLYFRMLDMQIAGKHFSKAECYREFVSRFPMRSKSAIERKCQNISACVTRLDIPFVKGLVPLGHFQAALLDAVTERVDRRSAALRAYALQKLPDGSDEDMDDSTVDSALVPTPVCRSTPSRDTVLAQRVRRSIDYAAREQSNRELGLKGELWVVRYEQAALRNGRFGALAERVRHVSVESGDGDGFDIASFDHRTGEPRLIEVKTTRASILTPFYVTRNELQVSERESDRYRLYRLHEFGYRTRFYQLSGALSESCELAPQSYTAQPVGAIRESS